MVEHVTLAEERASNGEHQLGPNAARQSSTLLAGALAPAASAKR